MGYKRDRRIFCNRKLILKFQTSETPSMPPPQIFDTPKTNVYCRRYISFCSCIYQISVNKSHDLLPLDVDCCEDNLAHCKRLCREQDELTEDPQGLEDWRDRDDCCDRRCKKMKSTKVGTPIRRRHGIQAPNRRLFPNRGQRPDRTLALEAEDTPHLSGVFNFADNSAIYY